MDVLEELYHGRLALHVKEVKEGSEYKKLNKKVISYETMLRELLSDEEMELLEKYEEALYHINKFEAVKDFKMGFCLGVRLMNECTGDIFRNAEL